jgi:hypothetical protein
LQEPPGILDRLFPAHLIGKKRHIPDYQSTLAAPGYGSRMVDHLVQGHGQGIRLPLKNTAHRIADKDDIDTRAVQYPRKGIIISRKAGNFFALLPAHYFRYGNFLCHRATLPK